MKLFDFIEYECKTGKIEVINEGGAGGHMDHPFDFASNGKQLVDVFNKTIKSLEKGSGSVKIDGVNASIRLVNGQFLSSSLSQVCLMRLSFLYQIAPSINRGFL